MSRTLLIDTDTASDDAVALVMALRSPAVRVAAITVVAGNVSLQQAVSNALYTAEMCGSTVPVFAGAAKPLLRPLRIADWFHGADGLGDHGFAPSKRTAEPAHAVDAILDAVRANPGVEIVTLGPLTNLALALARAPAIVSRVRRCVIMGGAPCCEGNVTPAAEYNIWVDPEAARMVFHSGLAIEMAGWHLCRGEAVVKPKEIEAILALDTPLADFAVRANSTALEAFHKQTGETGLSLPDPVAMSIALNPALCASSSRHYVDIETVSELTRGMTVVDRLHVTGHAPNADICWTLDVHGWKNALLAALR